MAKTQTKPTAEVLELPRAGVRYVGVDDGHSGIKVVTDGVALHIPARLAEGSMIELAGAKEDNFYQDESGATYTVSASLPFLDTRVGTYATSAANHVLIHHALIRAGLAGCDVRIVTGLPVNDFYIAGQQNTDLIDAKINSLASTTIRNRNADVQLARIVGHDVYPEAIAAFYDLVMDNEGNSTPVMDQVERGSIAIVDIGGKTTDIAVVFNGGTGVDPKRSGSVELGALSLNTAVEMAIKRAMKLDRMSTMQVDEAVSKGTIRLFGSDQDCFDIVKYEKGVLAQQIITEVKRRVGGGSDLEAVFFVGGGSALLDDELQDLYRHAVFVEDPQFSNGRGMWKACKYLLASE